MKLHILVEDDKRKSKSKPRKNATTSKASNKAKQSTTAKSDKDKAKRAYWAKRKAHEKKQNNIPKSENID